MWSVIVLYCENMFESFIKEYFKTSNNLAKLNVFLLTSYFGPRGIYLFLH